MQTAIKPLAQVALTASLANIYVPPTSPPNLQAIVKALWICNISAGAVTVTIRNGVGVLTSANSLYEAKSVPANDSIFLGGSDGVVLIVPAGAHLQGLCSSSGNIVVSVYGEEIS